MLHDWCLQYIQQKNALKKYAKAYVRKKRKSKSEKELLDTKKIYVIYARKSTEDSERQVQSIEDQIEHCKKYAKRNNLEVIDIIREEKSAKTAGRRLEFQRMLQVLKSGNEYNSILSWHPDRLARNMKESGEILDMLDNDIILDLQFPSYTFNNDTAGKMTLSILFAMAKEFSDKLSDDTKRGIQKTILEGKYCGSNKRGYRKARNGYYREDKNTYDIYKKAWDDYINGKPQQKILTWLKEQGEEISKNSLSNMFQDPFYAGFYCYGDFVVDMSSADHLFKPLVAPSAFLKLQKISRSNLTGWRNTSEFRPFNDFVLCQDCGHYMTSGVSAGNKDRYLSVTCGNSKCKERRREKGIKPLSNTIRGKIILDFITNFLENELKIDKNTYIKAKKKYFESTNTLIEENNKERKRLKIKLSKLRKEEEKVNRRLLDTKDKEVVNKLSNDFKVILSQIRKLDEDIRKIEVQNSEYEMNMGLDFPDFDSFLNLFENAVTVIRSTNDVHLIDQLVKLVFLNITVADKKVLKYELNEPFKTYKSLEILSGVDDGT